jgi:hypothetical protein
MECYQAYPQKEIFFDASRNKQIGNFDKLAGTHLCEDRSLPVTLNRPFVKAGSPHFPNSKSRGKNTSSILIS